MDSITQITLGAAVGELALGRKLGNRAMLWGALAGTMPDLDVMSNMVTDEMSALAYHRAFTHSITYAVVVPLILGPLIHRIYQGKGGPAPQSAWRSLLLAWLALIIVIGLGSWMMPIEIYGIPQIALIVASTTMIFPLVIHLREQWRRRASSNENVNWQAWSWLFFLAIVTHPLLDSCTTYGTQLFEPFSKLRVGWNNISVADPLYTLPFLLALIIASVISRGKKSRSWINIAGIAWSLIYMGFTVANKLHVNEVLADSLVEQNLTVDRTMTSPSILNNILWTGTAENQDNYYLGQYSLFDERPTFSLTPIAKGHDLLDGYTDSRDVQILQWFTNGFYCVNELGDGTLQLSDLRFGSMSNDLDNTQDFVFKFILEKKEGQIKAYPAEDMPQDRDMSEVFAALWQRIQGIKN